MNEALNTETITKQELKMEVKNLAEEMNCTFIEAASAMQAIAALSVEGESIIPVLGELKLESIGL